MTLTNGDLEQIADAVTMATEDNWVALEEHQKAAIDTLQDELHTLQLKTDTLQAIMTQERPPLYSAYTIDLG